VIYIDKKLNQENMTLNNDVSLFIPKADYDLNLK